MIGKHVAWLSLVAVGITVASSVGGCGGSPADLTPLSAGDDGGGGNGFGGGGSGAGGLTYVKTSIPVRYDAGLLCGNDLIAFGTGAVTGVSYVVPSLSPTSATPVSDTALYSSSGFAVGGKKIFLAGSNAGSLTFQVSVFDTVGGTILTTFPRTEICLASIPIDQCGPGNIQADGNYCVVICDPNEVTDQAVFKVIDATTSTPALVTFGPNPVDNTNAIRQVAIDGVTKKVVVAAYDSNDGVDKFFIYDITRPTAAPVVAVADNGINGFVQMKMAGSYLISLDDQGYPETILVNLSTGAVTRLADADSGNGYACASTSWLGIGSTKFLYFAHATSDDSHGATFRAAVGTVPGPGSTKAPLDQYIDGSTGNSGLAGFARTVAIRPSSNYIFIAGSAHIGSGEYLQVSTGSASFVVPPDPAAGGDSYGIPATDVACSTNTLGFKTGAGTTAGTSTTLGYAVLP